MQDEDINFRDILSMLKRKVWLILIITSMTVIIVSIISVYFSIPVYETRTKLFIGKETRQDSEYRESDIDMYQRLMKTYAELITTKDIVEESIIERNLNIDSKSVLEKLKVNQSTDTQILEITYRNSDKYLAREVIYSITNQFIKKSQSLIPNGKIEVIESVEIPDEPVSPKIYVNIAAALIFGLCGGIALAVLIECNSSAIKTKDQFEKLTNIVVLGAIPKERRK